MDRKQLKRDSESFALVNLADCARELLEWQNTALLRDGKVRELGRMCAVWAGAENSLKIAESLVCRAALSKVAEG